MPRPLKKILAIGFAFLFILFLSQIRISDNHATNTPTPQAEEWPAMEWKRRLKPLDFRGIVAEIDNDRNIYAIELKFVTLKNENAIPQFTRSFDYDSTTFVFPADGNNVHGDINYELAKGDIMIKKENNDTIFVYTADNKPKYLFEMLDGIAMEWIPRQWPK